MHQYPCPDCAFRVLDDDAEEVVHVARDHAARRHDEELSVEDAAERMEQVSLTDRGGDADDAADEADGLGPVRSGESADEW